MTGADDEGLGLEDGHGEEGPLEGGVAVRTRMMPLKKPTGRSVLLAGFVEGHRRVRLKGWQRGLELAAALGRPPLAAVEKFGDGPLGREGDGEVAQLVVDVRVEAEVRRVPEPRLDHAQDAAAAVEILLLLRGDLRHEAVLLLLVQDVLVDHGQLVDAHGVECARAEVRAAAAHGQVVLVVALELVLVDLVPQARRVVVLGVAVAAEGGAGAPGLEVSRRRLRGRRPRQPRGALGLALAFSAAASRFRWAASSKSSIWGAT